MQKISIYDFNSSSPKTDWKIVDDVVMGGVSEGKFSITKEGHGLFSGIVSTENNGGFSSVRHNCKPILTKKDSKIVLRVKGDGKAYQFRIKDKSGQYFAYITTFSTTGDWETITLSLKEFYPSFRGRRLDLPNYQAESFEEMTFLIANKKNEDFALLIDSISLKE